MTGQRVLSQSARRRFSQQALLAKQAGIATMPVGAASIPLGALHALRALFLQAAASRQLLLHCSRPPFPTRFYRRHPWRRTSCIPAVVREGSSLTRGQMRLAASAESSLRAVRDSLLIAFGYRPVSVASARMCPCISRSTTLRSEASGISSLMSSAYSLNKY